MAIDLSGIDGASNGSEISQRVQAYRNNPKELQKKYQLSNNLIDLLALQEIKTEMDSKARNMKLQQAQMDPEASMTTADKLVNNTVDAHSKRKESEVAEKIGKAYQNLNSKRKAAMNKFATNAVKRPTGIAAVNPRTMRQGRGLDSLQGTTLAAKSGGIMPKFAGTDDSFVAPVISPAKKLNTNVSFDDILAPTSDKVDSSAIRTELKKLIDQGSLDKAQNFLTKFGPMLGMSNDEKERMSQRRTAIEGDLADYQTETERLYSPEESKRRRRRTAIRGLGLGGLRGVPEALGLLAAQEGTSRDARGAVQRGLKQNLFNLDEKAVERNVADRRFAFGLTAEQVSQAEKNQLTAISQSIGLDAAQQAALSQDAKLLLETNIANLDANMRAIAQQHLLRIKNVDNAIKVDVANQSATLTTERLELDNNIKNLQLDIEEDRNKEVAFQQLSDIAGKMDVYSKAAIKSLTGILDIELANLRIKRGAASGSAAQDAVTDLMTQRELQYKADVATMLDEYNNRKNAILARLGDLGVIP